ncbi:hypothetical protein GY45DRAFT_1315239 [Cubamyces sp. BRFM 1775]|nr:hypothetical protein GY45DRAFT_1315239 [Cubamyces sp. BRFM 1775]
MRLIITGVTGVAGLAIYRAALADPTVQQITLLTRRPVPTWAVLPPNAQNKTETIIHKDFNTYPPDLAHRLAGHDALIWALGKSSIGMTEEEYTELTHGYTMAAARALKDAGAGSAENPFNFVYVSGNRADPTEQSGQMWARVKGRVERELPELFQGANMKARVVRPAYFFPSKKYPEDRLNQRSAFLRGFDVIATPLFSTFISHLYTPVEDLGRFCVELAKGRWPDQGTFSNTDLRKLVKELP